MNRRDIAERSQRYRRDIAEVSPRWHRAHLGVALLTRDVRGCALVGDGYVDHRRVGAKEYLYDHNDYNEGGSMRS